MWCVQSLTTSTHDTNRAREALRACLPDALRDGTFSTLLKVCLWDIDFSVAIS